VDNCSNPSSSAGFRHAGVDGVLLDGRRIGPFGVMGFIVGPVIAALFLALLELYGKEFGAQIAFGHNSIAKR
jgi:hypothetical protein